MCQNAGCEADATRWWRQYIGTSAESVLALFVGLPEEGRYRFLMTLQSYIDDSGQGHGPVYVLAGFVISVESGLELSTQWRSILDNGPRPLEYFKTFEAMNLRMQFIDWTEPERDECIDKLVSIILQRVLFRIRVTIPSKHFKSVIMRQLARDLNTPYFLAVYGIIGEMWRYEAEHGMHESVDFIFDEENKKHKKLVRKGWEKAKEFMPFEQGRLLGEEPVWRDDKRFLPLQAADLYAWHARQAAALLRRRGETYTHPVWQTLSKIKAIERDWTRTDMVNLVARCREIASGR
jgi:hypothetical protein